MVRVSKPFLLVKCVSKINVTIEYEFNFLSNYFILQCASVIASNINIIYKLSINFRALSIPVRGFRQNAAQALHHVLSIATRGAVTSWTAEEIAVRRTRSDRSRDLSS